MKHGHYLMMAGGVVLAADLLAGYQASSNAGVLPSWFSPLGTIEGYAPVLPLWAWLVIGGAGLNWYHHESIL